MENRQRGTVKTMKRGCWPRLPVEVWRCPGETTIGFLIRLFNTILERERMPEFKYLWLPIQSNRQCTRVVKKRVQAVSEWFVIEEQQQEWKARFARWWWDMLLCLVWRERREAGRWIFADFHWVRWVWRQSWEAEAVCSCAEDAKAGGKRKIIEKSHVCSEGAHGEGWCDRVRWSKRHTAEMKT